ncbi:hypothetical protein ACJ41O_009354 [Fusarium nematophilum]
MTIHQPSPGYGSPGDISIRIEDAPTAYVSLETAVKPPDEVREHERRTWKDTVHDTSITNTLILASFLLGLRIMTYHEKRSGDDDPIGRSLEHFFGRLLFPSTSGLVLAIIAFIPVNCAVFYRLRHSSVVSSALCVCLTRLVCSLVLDGAAGFRQALGCNFPAAAILCQFANGVEWLVAMESGDLTAFTI